MKLFKKFLIWIPVMTLAAVIGVLAAYLILDKQVSESTMAIGITGGVICGILVAVARHIKANKQV